MIDVNEALPQLIASAFFDELKEAIFAQRMGDSEAYHRLTDYVMEANQCELWQLVEALDIVNNEVFEGENPFTKRMEIAENMRKIAEGKAKESDRLRDIRARKDWSQPDIEGKILALQEKSEHWL